MTPFRQRRTDLTALEPARRRRDPTDGTGPEPIRRLVDMAFGDSTEEARARIARSVAARLVQRIRDRLDRLVAQGPAFGRPELHRLLQAEPSGADPFQSLAARLDLAGCLALLRPDEPELVSGLLRPGRGAGLNEAALEASLSHGMPQRLDQTCTAHCSARILVLLERLAPSELHRLEWRHALPLVESGPEPAPRHEEATEPALTAALQRGDNAGAVALLAAAALVPAASVQTAIGLRSRRGLVSLAWKAGFSMRTAVLLQSQLGGIVPESVLVAHADGSCPLTRNEMVWQISFLARRLA